MPAGWDNWSMRALQVRSESKVSMRSLLAFDPKRRTIFLMAGNKAAESQQVPALPKCGVPAPRAGPGDLLPGAAGHPWYTALGSCPDG